MVYGRYNELVNGDYNGFINQLQDGPHQLCERWFIIPINYSNITPIHQP